MTEFDSKWVEAKARAYIAGAIGFDVLPRYMVRLVKHRAQQIMGLEPMPEPEPEPARERPVEMEPELIAEKKPKPKLKKKTVKAKVKELLKGE